MGKKRRQAVGHPLETQVTDAEFASVTYEALLAAEGRIANLYACSARWKAVAKRWRKSALTLGIAQRVLLDALESLEEIEEEDDD